MAASAMSRSVVVPQAAASSVGPLARRPRRSSAVPSAPLVGVGAGRRAGNNVAVSAATNSSGEKPVFGMDASEGLFGFTPFAELWVGRSAMMGFLISVVEEGLTGQGTLQQIGFDTPSTSLLLAAVAVFGGATLVGTGATIARFQSGDMSAKQANRIRGFLRLSDSEAAEIKSTASALKGAEDPVRVGLTDDEGAIAAAKASKTPADAFLGDQTAKADAVAADMKENATLFKFEDAAEADSEAASMKSAKGTSVSLAAKDDILEQQSQASAELAYAKDVEMRNGRWAMIGFLAAVLVEAGTGHGIIMQLIDFGKITGLLGAESGF